MSYPHPMDDTTGFVEPATLVRIIDIFGRQPERVVPLTDEETLTSDEVDHILDMWADGKTAFIGEFEYQEVAP